MLKWHDKHEREPLVAKAYMDRRSATPWISTPLNIRPRNQRSGLRVVRQRIRWLMNRRP